MKFACPKCSTRYSVSSDKVPDSKTLRFTCKRCGHVIRLRRKSKAGAAAVAEQAAPAADEVTRVLSGSGDSGLAPQAAAGPAPAKAPPPPPADVEQWYVLMAGKQVGPISVTTMVEMLGRHQIDKRSYAWGSGMDDWQRLAKVSEFAELASRSGDAAWRIVTPIADGDTATREPDGQSLVDSGTPAAVVADEDTGAAVAAESIAESMATGRGDLTDGGPAAAIALSDATATGVDSSLGGSVSDESALGSEDETQAMDQDAIAEALGRKDSSPVFAADDHADRLPMEAADTDHDLSPIGEQVGSPDDPTQAFDKDVLKEILAKTAAGSELLTPKPKDEPAAVEPAQPPAAAPSVPASAPDEPSNNAVTGSIAKPAVRQTPASPPVSSSPDDEATRAIGPEALPAFEGSITETSPVPQELDANESVADAAASEVEQAFADDGAGGEDGATPEDEDDLVSAAMALAGKPTGKTLSRRGGRATKIDNAETQDDIPGATNPAYAFGGDSLGEHAAPLVAEEPQDKTYHKAAPGEATRVFMATAGIYKRRRQQRLAAVAAGVFMLLASAFIAGDVTGVFVVPGMGYMYERLNMEDPNVDRAIERTERKLKTAKLSPEEREKLRRKMLGLDRKRQRRGTTKRRRKQVVKRQAAPKVDGLAAERKAPGTVGGKQVESKKDLMASLYGDKRKKSSKIQLAKPDDVQTPNLPDGLTPEAIYAVIAENSKSINLCFAEAMRKGEKLKGKMEIEMTIAATGMVSKVLINTARFKRSSMGSCTRKRVKQWRFPKFKGESVPVVFPYVLSAGF